MTSKTSFFNKGIFFMTLRRFFWGSAAYFILLFLAVLFPVMMDPESVTYTAGFPIIFTFFVPPVTALLLFRCIHSRKQNIFIGSLPPTRGAFFLSTALGGFVLMIVPVLLCGLLLCALTAGEAGLFTFYDLAMVLLLQFSALMFSYGLAVFTSMLTGNSFMAAFLYFFIIYLPILIPSLLGSLLEKLVPGFMAQSSLSDALEEFHPFSWFFSHVFPDTDANHVLFSLLYALGGLLFLLGAFFIFRIRRTEKAGEVAAFSFLRPTLRCFLTAMAGILLFLAADLSAVNLYIYIPIVLLLLAVVYFACEMVFRKSFRVFDSYRGFLLFILCTAAIIGSVCATGLFGYRDYIPAADKIASAGIRSRYLDSTATPQSADPAAIEYVRKVHTDMLSQKNTDGDAIYIYYTLKNGKTVSRRYYADDFDFEIMERELFAYTDYKTSYYIPGKMPEKIEVALSGNYCTFRSPQDIAGFMSVFEAELSRLSYNELSPENYGAPDMIRFYVDDRADIWHCVNLAVSFPETAAWVGAHFTDNIYPEPVAAE